MSECNDGGFNPLAALNPESEEFIAEAGRLAEAMVVPGDPDNKESHWEASARAILAACLIWHQRLGGGAGRENLRRDLVHPEKE